MINVLYRLSVNGYKKEKFPNATKVHCLENALTALAMPGAKFYLFIDETGLTDDVRRQITEVFLSFYLTETSFYTAGSSAGSFRHVFNFALNSFSDDDTIYFLEDDYLHLSGTYTAIEEGIEIADYVSLYDHNDKYIPASKGGNPYIDDDGGEVTKVFRTKNHHWKLTNSTTMTFASKLKTLKDDSDIWMRHTTGTHPMDMQAFLDLRANGRSLITPIPGMSTHCEPQWASPGIDWSKV